MIPEIIGGMFGLYKVVPTDEAHVRILNNRREVFMSGKYKNTDTKSGYWVVPGITKLSKLPLTNISIPVEDIKLNDINMAKFVCDVVCFVKIDDPVVASERTGVTVEKERYEDGLENLSNDFRVMVESNARIAAAKQTILEIYKNRTTLDESITKELEKIFPEWGLKLVSAEIKDIKDVQGSSIISDIEKKSAAEISSQARVKIAEENSKAQIIEAKKLKEAEMEIAINEEEWQKRRVDKEKVIAIAEATKKKEEAERLRLANEALVEADQKLIVGNAENQKLKLEKDAEANKIKIRLEAEANKLRVDMEAEANSNKITKEGKASADIIRQTKLAEAEGMDKLAQAQAKFNEAALNLEKIRAVKEIQIAQAKAYAESLQKADIKIVAGSTAEIMSGGFFGNIKVGPKEGAAFDLFEHMGGKLPISNASESVELATKVKGVKAIQKGDS